MDFSLFENDCITDIEKKIRIKEIRITFFCLSFFVFIFFGLAILNKDILTPVYASEVTNEIAGEPRKMIITANVPSFFGVRRVSYLWQEKAYLVFGNIEQGFNVSDLITGEIIYTYKKAPGEGVVFKVPNDSQSHLFKQNY